MYQLWTHAMTMVIANTSIVTKRKSIISLCRAYNLKHLGGARTARADKPRSDVVSVPAYVLAPPARRPVLHGFRIVGDADRLLGEDVRKADTTDPSASSCS